MKKILILFLFLISITFNIKSHEIGQNNVVINANDKKIQAIFSISTFLISDKPHDMEYNRNVLLQDKGKALQYIRENFLIASNEIICEIISIDMMDWNNSLESPKYYTTVNCLEIPNVLDVKSVMINDLSNTTVVFVSSGKYSNTIFLNKEKTSIRFDFKNNKVVDYTVFDNISNIPISIPPSAIINTEGDFKNYNNSKLFMVQLYRYMTIVVTILILIYFFAMFIDE